MTFVDGRLHVLERFARGTPWTPDTGRVVRRYEDGSRTVIASGLNFPTGMAKGHDRALYASTVGYGRPSRDSVASCASVSAATTMTNTRHNACGAEVERM